jgi:anti-sigma regulatory factor (Ser/Thr protein kinase)
MIEVPAVLSLFGNESIRATWEPLLTQFPGHMMTLDNADSEIENLAADQPGFKPQIAIISSDLYPLQGGNLISRLRMKYPQLDVVVLAFKEAHPIPLRILVNDNVHHLTVADPEKESGIIRALLHALTANEPWELSSYLSPESDFSEFHLFDPREKEPIIRNIEDLISGPAADLEILRGKCALLADEMIENAMESAPGGAISQKGIIVRAGFDGETLALQVQDNWGRLNPQKALEHLARQQDTRASVEQSRGRGLFILWQFFDHFHVNITSGIETTIGGQLRRKSTPVPGQLKGFDFFHNPISRHLRSHYSQFHLQEDMLYAGRQS